MTSSVASRDNDFREIPEPAREADLLRIAVERLRDRLPAAWDVQADMEVPGAGGRRLDAVVRLTAPGGQRVIITVEAKRLINTRDVPTVLDQVRTAVAGVPELEAAGVVLIARYLAPSTRERIAAAGAGYIDATGNILVRADDPALFVSDRGADRDPWRGRGRPRGSLRGEPAARIVRALIDFAPPYSVPVLADRAGASTGAAYRVIDFLDQEDLIVRQPYGPISEVRWRPLLMRWSEDYGLAQANPVQTYLEPRGLGVLTDHLREAGDLQYVLTGSLAAERFAPYAPARLAMIYVEDPAHAVSALDLRPTETGANVALAAASYAVVFDREQTIDGLRIAAPGQVAVDLLSGPGRNPSEATALLDWMQANEPTWRR